MSGNVWEWCWDLNSPYRRLRGGSWSSYSAVNCAFSYRFIISPDNRNPSYGLRLVRSAGT